MKYVLVLFFYYSLHFAIVFGATEEHKEGVHPAFRKDIQISPSVNDRIVNGLIASRYQFPYQISLEWGFLFPKSHICGGTIISHTYVLSAAHCIVGYGSYNIKAGILDRSEVTMDTQSKSVAETIVHPLWPGGKKVAGNDISLLKVTTPFSWTAAVQPAFLPVLGEDFSGEATVSGWGLLTTTDSTIPVRLHYAKEDLITLTECADDLVSVLGNTGALDSTMVCTSGISRVSVCSGDSGGPLVQYDILVGVVSWGISPCGTENAPSVYTRVSNYINWIQSYVTDLP